jgi:hypothetical protein
MFLWESYVGGKDTDEVWSPADLVNGHKRRLECRNILCGALNSQKMAHMSQRKYKAPAFLLPSKSRSSTRSDDGRSGFSGPRRASYHTGDRLSAMWWVVLILMPLLEEDDRERVRFFRPTTEIGKGMRAHDGRIESHPICGQPPAHTYALCSWVQFSLFLSLRPAKNRPLLSGTPAHRPLKDPCFD